MDLGVGQNQCRWSPSVRRDGGADAPPFEEGAGHTAQSRKLQSGHPQPTAMERPKWPELGASPTQKWPRQRRRHAATGAALPPFPLPALSYNPPGLEALL